MKRKPYTPKKILCEGCSGTGRVSHRAYPSGRAAVSVTECRPCGGSGMVVPSPITHAPDCTGCRGIFKCAGCLKFFGWCVGAADDMPDHCDDCWSKAHPAPVRVRVRFT